MVKVSTLRGKSLRESEEKQPRHARGEEVLARPCQFSRPPSWIPFSSACPLSVPRGLSMPCPLCSFLVKAGSVGLGGERGLMWEVEAATASPRRDGERQGHGSRFVTLVFLPFVPPPR